MGRGVSSGGGQSSLGYLFGSDEPAKGSRSCAPAAAPPPAAAPTPSPAPPQQHHHQHQHHHATTPGPPAAAGISRNLPTPLPTPPASKRDDNGDVPVVKLGRNNNNYHRADGQNTGNFITDRPSTKVHAAPGGGSSLGYLFGGNCN